jgi:hypothetical protein
MMASGPPPVSSAIGHGLATVAGFGSLLAGIEAVIHSLPGALSGALVICGLVMPLLGIYSWRGKRAPWAFLTTMCGVLALCMLFGAPKVHTKVGIDLALALMIPVVLAVAAIMLASQHREYTES